MLKVGFTGSRDGMTSAQANVFEAELQRLMNEFGHDNYAEFHHGDCIGADAEAQQIARAQGYKIHCHPPEDSSKRAHTQFDVAYDARPYRERNRVIVQMTSHLLACPKSATRTTSGGTWYTYNHAAQQGSYKRAMLIYPDGVTLHPKDRWLLPL